jgi:hypothetical protein
MRNWTFPTIVLVIAAITIPLQCLNRIPTSLVAFSATVQAGLVIFDRNKNGYPDHEKWVVDMMIIIVGVAIGASASIFGFTHDLFDSGNMLVLIQMIGSILTMVGAEVLIQSKARIKAEKRAMDQLNYDCPTCGPHDG